MPAKLTGKDLEDWLSCDRSLAKSICGDDFWRTVQPVLASRGYALRPRYHSDWTPSWRLNGRWPTICEDGVYSRTNGRVLDAFRLRDRTRVAIKRVKKTEIGLREIAMMQYLSSGARGSDSRNHCVPLLGVIDPGESVGDLLVITPLLQEVDQPDNCLVNVGEVLEFCHQILQGLAFMHEQNVEHRDCCLGNIMLYGEPLSYEGRHPEYPELKPDLRDRAPYLRRSHVQIQYYFIDFGLSILWSSPDDRKAVAWPRGQDKSAPELQDRAPSDGFALDVYCVGNMFRSLLFPNYPRVVPLLQNLVESMTRTAPAERPSSLVASMWMDKIYREVTTPDLGKRLAYRFETSRFDRLINDVDYALQNLKWWLRPKAAAAVSTKFRKYSHIPYRLPSSEEQITVQDDISGDLMTLGLESIPLDVPDDYFEDPGTLPLCLPPVQAMQWRLLEDAREKEDSSTSNSSTTESRSSPVSRSCPV